MKECWTNCCTSCRNMERDVHHTWTQEGRGVHFTTARDCHSPSDPTSAASFTQTPRLYWGTNMYPAACCWAHLHVCSHTAYVAEWKANFEDLTTEICCWMLLISRYHKPKRYWLALIHSHKTVSQVWSSR